MLIATWSNPQPDGGPVPVPVVVGDHVVVGGGANPQGMYGSLFHTDSTGVATLYLSKRI